MPHRRGVPKRFGRHPLSVVGKECQKAASGAEIGNETACDERSRDVR